MNDYDELTFCAKKSSHSHAFHLNDAIEIEQL